MKIKKTERLSSSLAQHIGTRIKVARTRKEWTQKDLALHAGFKQSTISAIEKGKVNLTLSSIFRLEAALSCAFLAPFPLSKNEKIEIQLQSQAIDILTDQGVPRRLIRFEPLVTKDSELVLAAWSVSKRADGSTLFTTVRHSLKDCHE